MGAWGRGLLQNDDALDGLLAVAEDIESDIAKLRRRRPAEALAGRLAGAVGLLLQLQFWHCFDPEHEDAATLQAVLERHEPMFSLLPKTAAVLLGEIRKGKGPEIVRQDGPLPAELGQAFYGGSPDSDFPMERGTGVRHAGMFEHPASAAYVQECAVRWVKRISRGFRDEDQLSEMHGEGGETIAALCMLLQLEPCQVDPENFRDWWRRYRTSIKEMEEADEGWEDEFDVDWGKGLKTALDYGLRRFSGKAKIKPLED